MEALLGVSSSYIKEGGNMAQEMIKPKVLGTFNASTTTVYTCPKACHMFSIINKGAADLTFTINGITITVEVTQCFEDYFEEFKTVTVTATTAFSAIVKGF